MERWDNPPRKHSKRKKNIVVQYRCGDGQYDDDNLFIKYMRHFYKHWTTFGKYEDLEDAGRALKVVARENHIFHTYDFRVLIKGEHILKSHVTPESLALMLMYGKGDEDEI